jgi:molecular chaperone GrpE
MIYSSDPFNRRRRTRPSPTQGTRPTLEDYQALAQAFQQVQQNLDEVRKQLAETNRELAIKNEALQRQSADLKSLESELVWTKAALNSQEPRAKSGASAAAQEEDAGVWRNRFMRLQADLDNLRKRTEQRVENETADARHRILLDMLPLADHLELALLHGQSDPEQADSIHRDFLRNVEATLRAFLDTLQRYGVERIEALGQPFDPNWHEAVGRVEEDPSEQPTGSVEPNTVVRVVQSGYRDGSRLLRPARVLISAAETSATNTRSNATPDADGADE